MYNKINNFKVKNSKFIFGLIFFISIGFLLGTLNLTSQVTADDLTFDEQTATVRAIKKNIPAVVSIVVYNNEDYSTVDSPLGGSEIIKRKVQQGEGSGFIISSDGYIVTNKHVINAGDDLIAKYSVILNSGQEYDAKLIGKDPFNDLAVLKIETGDVLQFINLGDSSKLELGMTVVAIGNSLGRYQNSVTKGVISGLERDLTSVERGLTKVIQTDAEINLGNSGGPLIDLSGKVVGINVAKDKSGSSIGFAIPINDARPIIDGIKNYQRIVRPIMGVKYLQLDEKTAGLNHLTRSSGAWIKTVIENSPARNAGILPDDIIFEVNAVEVTDKNVLANIVQGYKPGDRIGVKLQRGEKVLIKIVTLGEYSNE